MIGTLFTAGTFANAALSGVSATIDACAAYVVRLALKSRAVDDETGAAIVDAARADAPQLTGALVNGITWRAEGDSTVVEASALRVSGGETWDYAPFTELGTSREAAEPFFYGNAERILAERGARLERAADSAATESGLA